ncbi:hypothetical protein DM860_003869 [Cuscuta australis]|uniref:Uncharacterized protein n=1 Tax=Cuscuta australis TaxID=267555 RepID=A0A328CUR4_9ASTE|nr:hypothetical protein DM860_003869 [Cuscuta australis]
MADKKASEFWLPPEFLSDEDLLMDPYAFEKPLSRTLPRSNLLSPSAFPHGRSFSPVPSSVFSGVEESEEELLSWLTSRFRRTALDEEGNKSLCIPRHSEKGGVISGSPQSTLAMVGSWTGRRTGSSNGSPFGPSQASSPTTPPLCVENDDLWALIFRDAVQARRARSTPDALFSDHPSIPPANLVKNSISGAHVNPFHQLRALRMMQQQCSEMWGQKIDGGYLGGRDVFGNRGNRVGFGIDPFVETGNSGIPVPGQTAAWPALPPQRPSQYGRSDMIAAFPGGYGAGLKRECAGTGVFIPRRYESNNNVKTSADLRKPTSKISNGVNKRSDGCYNGGSRAQIHPSPGGFSISDYEILIARSNAALLEKRRRSMGPQPEVSISPELRLPPEWTY